LIRPFSFYRRSALLVVPGFQRRMQRILGGIPLSIDQTRDPMFEQDALTFWRKVTDRKRVDRWRIASMCARVVLFCLIVGLLSRDASLALGYAFGGGVAVSTWLILASNDARKLRKGLPLRPSLFSRPGRGRPGGIAWWRWLIWIIALVNVLRMLQGI
jgi:hypothetical protein